jgi:hypothetical protein
MATAVSSNPTNHQVAFNRLLWVGPLTIVVAILANAIIWQIAVAILQPDPLFVPLSMPAPIFFTLFGVLGAVIVFALVGRFSQRPIWLFNRIAFVTLLITFIPDVLMLLTGFNPGTMVANVLALMLMHIVAWAITVYMLTTLARA